MVLCYPCRKYLLLQIEDLLTPERRLTYVLVCAKLRLPNKINFKDLVPGSVVTPFLSTFKPAHEIDFQLRNLTWI